MHYIYVCGTFYFCFLLLILNFTEAPRIIGVLSADVNRDDTVNLSCVVSSFPASNITWKYKGKTIPTSSQKYELLDSVYTLKIRRVKFEDAGLYECTLVNELGEARANASLVVGCK